MEYCNLYIPDNPVKQMDEGRGMAAVSAVMIQGGFLFYGIVGNVKIAVFQNEELIPLGILQSLHSRQSRKTDG